MGIVAGLPVVGHSYAAYHYITGDSHKGGKVLKAANRTSVVMAGGVLGGPAGALGAGFLMDTVTSVAEGKPVGYIHLAERIGSHVRRGQLPYGAVVKTVLTAIGDISTGKSANAIRKGFITDGSGWGMCEITKFSAKRVLSAGVKKVLRTRNRRQIKCEASVDSDSDYDSD